MSRPSFANARLGHAEVCTDKLDASLDLFTRAYRLTEPERKKGQARGLKTIDSFDTRGAPPVAAGGRPG